MKRTFFINLLLMTVALSCSVNDFKSEAVVNATESQEFRSIESALSSLEDFIRKNYPSTKSFVIRSIGRYYGDCPRTKGDDESTPEPLAYVVNFGDGDGFAVLGTRKEHPDIVAITESGSIDTLTLAITFDNYHPAPLESDPDDISSDSLGFYCAEDDDFYCSDSTSGAFVTALLKTALDKKGANIDPEPEGPIDDDKPNIIPYEPGRENQPYHTCQPLINYNWNQDNPYNKYCKRKNGKIAYTGCSNTALSMILARNECPQNTTINGERINWRGIKTVKPSDATVNSLSRADSLLNQISLLMGYNFNKVHKLINKSGTLITPAQIRWQMKRFGYRDTYKYSGHSFNGKMIKATSDMLKENLPVFISAIPKKWKNGHSWVIDGAQYSTGGKYLVHCNFGWGGKCNGYFSVSCIDPYGKNADNYGISEEEKKSKSGAYTWHFRVIKYKPDSLFTVNFKFG